jgi:hypothetical protein
VVRPFYEDFEGETDGTAITVGNTNFTRIDTGESELSPGTLEFDTADAAAGSGSGLFTALTTDSSQAYGVFFLDDGPIQFLRFYMKPVTAGPITSLIVQLKGRGGTIDPGGGPSEDPPLPDGVIGGQLAITAGRQIRLRDQSGTNVDGTGMAALPVGEWARVEMMADTTNDVLEVRQFTGANVHGTTPSDSRQFTSYTFVPDTPGWYYGQVGLIHFNNGWTAAFDEPETSAVDWLGPVVTPVDVAVAHGIALGHSAVAGLQADVVVAQGLAVGHMGTVAATATVVAAHGLALGQSAAAAAATVAAVAHGIAFDETAVAAGGATVVDVAHGLLLGHAAAATVASEGVAATATSGIAVGHVATAAAGTGAAVHHGVALGSSAVAAARIAAVVSQGLTVAHSASGERAATTAQAVHGLTVGEAAELDVGAAGVVAVHGVAVGQSAVVGLHAGADVAHGLVLGASAAAAAQVRAAAAHGVAFTHAAQVTHGDVVSAQVAHGLELSHQAAAFEQPAARAAHGLVLGHAAQAGAQVAAVAAHGLAVGGQVQVFHGAGVAAQVVHGLVVGHASQAVATFTVAASHGVVLGHATVAAVILDVFAQVAHGLALGHVVSGRVGADTVLPVVAHARFGGPAVANGVYRPAGGGGSTGPAVVSGRT